MGTHCLSVKIGKVTGYAPNLYEILNSPYYIYPNK